MAARLRSTRFRVGEADASQLLPPPLPLYQIPADTRVARTGVPEERPMHLPVRRHLAYLRGERPPPTPVLAENRLAIETEVRENSERAVLSRVVVYEYNHPEAVERPDDSLEFDSLFESGNLLRAERIVRAPAPGQEYELLIHPDVRNGAYRQWFYFEVRNGKPGVEYRFSFANLAKSGALFGAGLQPVVYSEKEAEASDVGWVHAGFHVRYGPSWSIDGAPPNNELSFHYRFAHADDRVYFACIQPYTYTDLVEYLERLEGDPQRAATLRRTELCQTIAENTCDLLTITSPPAVGVQPEDRQIIVLSARVHPGEPNSSWMMKGMLDYLTGSSAGAAVLRRHFVFKVVPMLNPDGVVNGNTRVNLAGWDLNRKWASPIEKMFPTIFHLKRLLANYQSRDRVAVYCDLHGHSLSRNIFTYGCYSRKTGAATTTTTSGIKSDPRVLPMIVARNSPLFSFASCDFKVHKSKLSTARVVVHRELRVVNSYTLEASFCGPNFGPRKDTQFSTWDLEDMGRSWCQSLLVYFGLVSEVKALEAERGRELQQSEAAAAARDNRVAQNESEDEGEREGETRPLDLLSNALDDIEAAITELFAQTRLEDTDVARGGGADLSDAEEEPAPPDASLAAVAGDSDGDQERSRKKKVRRRKRPRGRSKSTKKGEGRKKREDGKPKTKKKTKAKRKASVERAPRADSDKDDSGERQPRARRTSTNRRRSRSRSRAAAAAAKAFIDHDANPVGISVSARDAETSGGGDRGVRVLPSVLDLPTTTERRLRTAPANCREDERRRQSLGRVSSGARLELPALVGPDAKAAALRPAAADSESEPPSDDDEEDSDESEQSEPAEAYGSDF